MADGAFAVAAVVLGGFTLYNLSGSYSSMWAKDPQARLQDYVPGNKHANINLPALLTLWTPTSQPGDFARNSLYARKSKSRLDAISADPIKRANASAQIMRHDYRRGQGFMVDTQHAEVGQPQWG